MFLSLFLCSPLVHVCAVLWPGCSPYGSGDMENLSLSSFSHSVPSSVVPPPSLPLPHFRHRTHHAELFGCTLTSPSPSIPPSILSSFSYITLSLIPYQFLMVFTTHWRREIINMNRVCPSVIYPTCLQESFLKHWKFCFLNVPKKNRSGFEEIHSEKKSDDSCQIWQLWFKQYECMWSPNQPKSLLYASFLLYSPHLSLPSHFLYMFPWPAFKPLTPYLLFPTRSF